MPEIGTLGLMSGDGKRGAGHRPQATAPILDSTIASSQSLYMSALALQAVRDFPERGPMRTTGVSSNLQLLCPPERSRDFQEQVPMRRAPLSINPRYARLASKLSP